MVYLHAPPCLEQQFTPVAIKQALVAAAQQADDAAEQLCAAAVAGTLPVEDFIRQYCDAKTVWAPAASHAFFFFFFFPILLLP